MNISIIQHLNQPIQTNIFTAPYLEGARLIKVGFEKSRAPEISLAHRITEISLGVLLLIPIVNTIIYLALKRFSSPNPEQQTAQDAPLPFSFGPKEEWLKSYLDHASGNFTEKLEPLVDELKKQGLLNYRFQGGPLLGSIMHLLAKSEIYLPTLKHLLKEKEYLDFALLDLTAMQNTALMWAIANAINSSAWEIIETSGPGPHLNAQDGGLGNTALHLAIGKGYRSRSMDGQPLKVSNIAIAKKLIELGADVNLHNKDGYTPLHLACIRRDEEEIKLLLEAGAKPDRPDIEGKTPQDYLDLSFEEALSILKNQVAAFELKKETFEASSSLHALFLDSPFQIS